MVSCQLNDKRMIIVSPNVAVERCYLLEELSNQYLILPLWGVGDVMLDSFPCIMPPHCEQVKGHEIEKRLPVLLKTSFLLP
jgi:hypothetical protein